MFKRLKETILEIIQQADLILLGLCCVSTMFGIVMIFSAAQLCCGAFLFCREMGHCFTQKQKGCSP